MNRHSLVLCLGVALLARGTAFADRTTAERENEAGLKALQAGAYEEAYARFSRAIDADPAWPVGYESRASVTRYLRRQVSGLEDIRTAISLAGSACPAEYERYRLLLLKDLSRWNRIALDAPAAVKRWPEDPILLQLLGNARINTGEIEAGLADLEAVRKIRKEADAYAGIPEAFLLMADTDSALRVFEEMQKELGGLDQIFHLE